MCLIGSDQLTQSLTQESYAFVVHVSDNDNGNVGKTLILTIFPNIGLFLLDSFSVTFTRRAQKNKVLKSLYIIPQNAYKLWYYMTWQKRHNIQLLRQIP